MAKDRWIKDPMSPRKRGRQKAMTTRKGFFTALLTIATATIAKAQQTIITPCRPKIQWGNQIPLCNGQCPQPDCGYRAPEFYKRSYAKTVNAADTIGLVEPLPDYSEIIKHGEVYWERSTDGSFLLIPSKRLNRCPNCNTAFWQDPQEGGKTI